MKKTRFWAAALFTAALLFVGGVYTRAVQTKTEAGAIKWESCETTLGVPWRSVIDTIAGFESRISSGESWYDKALPDKTDHNGKEYQYIACYNPDTKQLFDFTRLK